MKEVSKCFNYGGADHFSRECKSKKVDTSEVENQVDDEESSDEDKGMDKYLMTCIDETTSDEGSSELSSFRVDIAKFAKESKIKDWDPAICIS